MTAQDNIELIRRYQDLYNRNELDALDEILSPEMIMHNFLPGMEPNIENAKKIHQMTLSAYPDFHTQIEDIFGADDKVTVRFTMTGTHRGEFMGIPATGVKIRVTGISIFRLAGGKIVEHWGEEDSLGWMQQLGVFRQ